MEFVPMTIKKQKNIALIAHDQKKHELMEWCKEHKSILEKHFLCGTGTTARMITDYTGLPVKGYNSGPDRCQDRRRADRFRHLLF